MSTIEIHEFSTGVKVQSSQVGTQVLWWVEDYTEEDFMNCTLEPIPDVVYQAIDEELLKIQIKKRLGQSLLLLVKGKIATEKKYYYIVIL